MESHYFCSIRPIQLIGLVQRCQSFLLFDIILIMKKFIQKIKDIYHSGDNAFYASLVGPLLMGTIHLVFVIINFDWILLNYCLFFYLMAIFKVWQWSIEKYHIKPNHFVAGIISMLVIIAPMMAAFVLTILFRDTPHYFLDWLIYAYALYGTLRMVFAIKNLVKKDKTDQQYVLSFLNLLGALYTVQMMEFCLIKTFSTDGVDNSMYLMQLFSQGAIFLFSIFVIVLFMYKAISLNKQNKNKLN